MAKGLTVRAVEVATAKERREIPDGYLRGLFLIVQPTGAKSWAVRYRHQGRSRKHTLGPYPALDLKNAREIGAKALRAVAEGRDPGREKAQFRQPNSIELVVEQFLALHVRQFNRPKTARETERLLRRYVLPHWRGRSIDNIARRDVIEVLDRVVENGTPIMANRVLAATGKLFSWALSRDILAASPCAGVKRPAKERPRERVLTDDELKLVWEAAEQIGFPFGKVFQMLILTGQRLNEVGRVSWSEIKLEQRLWTLPPERVKNEKEHEVPLSSAALDILTSVPRLSDKIVFTTNGRTAASGFSKAKLRIDALAPTKEPWRLHDLRRTVASGMARLGINLPVIEKVLNHASGSFAGIVGVYQRHTFADEKRAALQAWGNFVAALIEGKHAERIVRLREKRP
jgi:integrase